MFRDDKQTCRAMLVLLGGILHDVGHYWTETGPTKAACRYIKVGSPLSHGEHLVLQVAFDFWNHGGGAKFAELLTVLDQCYLEQIFELSLAVAKGPNAIDAWIGRYSVWPVKGTRAKS